MLPSTPDHASETVSVVIPTRNRPRMAVAAVQSALAQTHPTHEILVVIDGPENPGPTQSTAEALRAIDDPRLRILALPQSVGGGEARNTGVRAATGHWIAFLDDDDLWLPEKLARQLAFARTLPGHSPERETIRQQTADTAQPAHASSRNAAQTAVLSCPVLARSPDWHEVWPRHPYRPGQPMSEYLFCRRGFRYGDALLQTSTLLAPRDLFARLPFTPNLLKHQDWDWLLRAAADPLVSVHSVGIAPLAVFHVEGNRPSVGRSPNWRFSLEWARDRKALFTPRAFAAFLATECAAQAARAPWSERRALLRLALGSSSAYPRTLPQLAAFLLIPQPLRRRLRDCLRRTHPRPTPGTHKAVGTPSAPML